MSNEPPATPATAKGTRYIALQLTSTDTYTVIGNTIATSADAALRTLVKDSGTYVAVPHRSFAPIAVTVEQVTSVKLG